MFARGREYASNILLECRINGKQIIVLIFVFDCEAR